VRPPHHQLLATARTEVHRRGVKRAGRPAGGTDGLRSTHHWGTGALRGGPKVGLCVSRVRKLPRNTKQSGTVRRGVAQGHRRPRRGPSAVAVLGHDQIPTRDPATPGARRHPSRDNSPCGPNGHTGDVFANRNGGGRHLPTRRLYVEGPWMFEWETFVDTLRVAVFH